MVEMTSNETFSKLSDEKKVDLVNIKLLLESLKCPQYIEWISPSNTTGGSDLYHSLQKQGKVDLEEFGWKPKSH